LQGTHEVGSGSDQCKEILTAAAREIAMPKGFAFLFVLWLGFRCGTAALAASPWLAAYCQGAPLLQCQWSRITEVTKILTNDRGTLFRVQQQSCFKDYRNGRHPKTYNCKSTEIANVSDVAVYCSQERPTVAQYADNGWAVLRLSFDDENDYHTIHWDNRLYFLVCYSNDIGENSNIVGFDKLAKRFGYHPIDLSKVNQYTKVDTIEGVAAGDRD
jgi:hypothetical protein